MKPLRSVALFPFVFFLCACTHVPLQSSGAPLRPPVPPYHQEAPTDPLPPTKTPDEFQASRSAFVAYSLAPNINILLYQVPCYCPCRKIEGHTSLLDCFTGNHGAKCAICQKELLFCYRRQNENPAKVRKALARGVAWKLDLDEETQKFYRKIVGPTAR